jgi:uncharacterized protein YcbX
MPGGRRVADRVRLGEARAGLVPWDGLRPVAGREVLGPWSQALSEHLGEPATLVLVASPAGAVDVAPVTLVSEASIARLERQLGTRGLGSGRFRMNVVIDGVAAHEEDEWYGRRLSVGGCVLRITGPVPRCAVITRDPASGRRDADALRAIRAYRQPIALPGSREPVTAPFGVYAEPERPGRISVGDRAERLR